MIMHDEMNFSKKKTKIVLLTNVIMSINRCNDSFFHSDDEINLHEVFDNHW
jgi:hypothetical protein